ncbi:Uncharacterised protein [Mycobacteroides abscessus subsp. abscessus]|nr:Uncharacterised protein [Mycobacteroides abscessus subsp. abscessus]
MPENQRCTHAWKAVPRRASGFGGYGSGLRSRRASFAGSARNSTSAVAGSCPGSSTSRAARTVASCSGSSGSVGTSVTTGSRSGDCGCGTPSFGADGSAPFVSVGGGTVGV